MQSTQPAVAELTSSAQADPAADAKKDRARRQARRLRQALALAIILILIFTVASLAIVRFSRRYRAYLLDRKTPPTPSDDVWSMHKLPDEQPPDAAPPPEAEK